MLHSTALRNDMVTATHGVGSGVFDGGQVRLYSGGAPATADAAETGTNLVAVTLPSPCFPAPVAGVATANAISGSTILATGVIGYGRVVPSGDGGGVSTTIDRMQFSVGLSGAELIVNTTNVVVGGTFTITGFTYTAPL